MKVLVTGGTGFIGSHLVKALLQRGNEVIVTSSRAGLGLENLSNLGIAPSAIEVRWADLTDYRQAVQAVRGAAVVFHLAARVGSLEYLHGSKMAELTALQSNLLIDINVFRACLQAGVGKLVYASSCAVYPLYRQFSPGAVFSESDLELRNLNFLRPRIASSGYVMSLDPDGGYGWAKLLGEIQLSWLEGIEVGIARIFNIYGENEPLGENAHVVADLCKKAILYPRENFIVHGDGSQTRDLLYVSDCVEALVRLSDKLSTVNESPLVINIGSGKATSVREIAEKIAQLSGKGIKPAYNSEKPTGPVSRTANIEKARRLLGWEPTVSLDEGLERTFRWVEMRLKRNG
jgi:GDP-D-mannose 3',5'-epimerase